MIEVLPERCTECGECIAVCSHDAIHLEGGQTVIDNRLCTECLACQQACPVNAIQEVETEIVPTELFGEVVHIPNAAISQPQHSQLLPVISAAILWTGREIIPRITTLALDILECRLQEKKLGEAPARNGRSRRTHGGRLRQRQRQYHGYGGCQNDNSKRR
jgi:dissimilatory sulfite reductase (desulfoviridin) alpha/beta subunit